MYARKEMRWSNHKSSSVCGFFLTHDLPIQLNKKLIEGHSWVGLVIVNNSGAANSIQLINEHYTWSMLSGGSWKLYTNTHRLVTVSYIPHFVFIVGELICKDVKLFTRPGWNVLQIITISFLKKSTGKVCIRAMGPIRLALNSGLCSMKQLGVLQLHLGRDASPSQGYLPALWSTVAYLYTWVKI